MSLMPIMTQIAEDYDKSDYQKLKNDAHSLKGASGYIGAGQIHYACYFI